MAKLPRNRPRNVAPSAPAPVPVYAPDSVPGAVSFNPQRLFRPDSKLSAPPAYHESVIQRDGTRFTAEELDHFKQTFGTILRNRRLTANLSQKELADQADCGQSQISRIEKGQSLPSEALLKKLESALGVEQGHVFEALKRDFGLDAVFERRVEDTGWQDRLDVNMKTGVILMLARQAQGLDQKSVARGADISPAYYNRLETGIQQASRALTRNLERALHLMPDELHPMTEMTPQQLNGLLLELRLRAKLEPACGRILGTTILSLERTGDAFRFKAVAEDGREFGLALEIRADGRANRESRQLKRRAPDPILTSYEAARKAWAPQERARNAVALGAVLRRMREAQWMEQAEAAAFSGITRGTWNNYEKGRDLPTGVVLAEMTRALGAPAGFPYHALSMGQRELEEKIDLLGLQTEIGDIVALRAGSPAASVSASDYGSFRVTTRDKASYLAGVTAAPI